MKTYSPIAMILGIGLAVFSAGCEKKAEAKGDPTEGSGPAAVTVESDLDANNFKVENPERFPLATAEEHVAAPEMNVTGVVTADVSRQVPVPSLATGRVVEIDARLGDEVKKGQLLFKVRSSDISGAYADYRKAVKNEQLAKIQLNRSKILFDDGAIPKSALEIAQTTEDNAAVDVETAEEHLKLLGSDPNQPTGIVEVYAPVSGVITDQQITNSSGVQALSPPNPFTISDVSHVWVVCDVFENNMSQVQVGQYADIKLDSYPNQVFKARINNILPQIDPNIRTAKVRLELSNPGMMRLGMFVSATFHGLSNERRATVPATAILHLHDREWVYTPGKEGHFKRLEVVSGSVLPGNLQEIVSGVRPGDKVIANALVFQSTVEQ
ncbi:MAG TPA: efflux RND transporter periplasmic adaptor subunit [Bryobacteraceae bacterium]